MDRAVAEWVRLATRDIQSAGVLLSAGDVENALFLCQQAVEKALKALVQETTVDAPPKTHNLLRLAALANVWDAMEEQQQSVLFALSPHAVLPRYPIDPGEAGTHLLGAEPGTLRSQSEEVVKWLLNRLRSRR